MMEERINQALVQLENDLQNITSAREQVEKTIGASAELQNTVGEYIASVKSLCTELNTWVSNLRERESLLGHDVKSAITDIDRTCSNLIDKFNTDVTKTTSSFQNETKATFNILAEQNNKFAEHVEYLNSFCEQIEKNTESLNDIHKEVANISTKLHEEALNAIQSITNYETTIKDTINNNANKIFESTERISSKIDTLSTLCKDIKSSISSSTKYITQAKNDIFETIVQQEKRINSKLNHIKIYSVSIVTLTTMIIILCLIILIR